MTSCNYTYLLQHQNIYSSPKIFPMSSQSSLIAICWAALNKWLKSRVPEGCVIHSFRHSLRDRLRAVQCPSDMIDQIGGWSTASVGQGYGEGYELLVLAKLMRVLS